MSQNLARRDYQLHRIEAALAEMLQWPERKRFAMRSLIRALEAERDEVLRSHSRSMANTSRRLAGLVEGLAA